MYNITTLHGCYFFFFQIKLDIPDAKSDQYDDCNSLVLPSVKRKTKVKNAHEPKAKLLTKKQRKNLEKIVENKKKEAVVSWNKLIYILHLYL